MNKKEITFEEYNQKISKIAEEGLSVEDTLTKMFNEAGKYKLKKQDEQT